MIRCFLLWNVACPVESQLKHLRHFRQTRMKTNIFLSYNLFNNILKGELYMLFKNSAHALAVRLFRIAVDAGDQFNQYLSEDPDIYKECITITPIKNTSFIFIITLYREILICKYPVNKVFLIIRTAITMSSHDKQIQENLWESFLQYAKICYSSIEYYSKKNNNNVADVLTKVYFSLVIDNKSFLIKGLDTFISQSVSYRKIYQFIEGTLKHPAL